MLTNIICYGSTIINISIFVLSFYQFGINNICTILIMIFMLFNVLILYAFERDNHNFK